MQEGISVDEACVNNAIGTKEDFERSCNPDGTVKEPKETTTISLVNSDYSVTIDNTYLQLGLAAIIIVIVVSAVLIIRKIIRKNN